MSVLPAIVREVRIVARPHGLPTVEHFSVVEVPLPIPAENEVLVRNLAFRVSASIRMMISEGAEAVEGVPFPALAPGDTLAEQAVGEVVSAPGDSGLIPGDLVSHHLGYREYAVVPLAALTRLPERPADPIVHLGHGWTAYAALTRGLQIRDGAPIADQLAAAAPEGVDVVLDTVGGEQLTASTAIANPGARILLIGALSGQLATTGAGRTAPVELDSFRLLLKKLTLRGYSADDDPAALPEWNERFAARLRTGDITFPHERINGIANAPQAIVDTIGGRHLGTVIVDVG